jgi:D-glutamate N-acetyltransferase
MSLHNIRKPYLLLVGDVENPRNAKTAFGLRDWTPEACVGQLRFNDKAVDLGLPEMSPEQAQAAGAQTLVIGIAPLGGQLPENWHRTLLTALEAGLDIAAGLHQRVGDIAEIAACAAKLGRLIHDVRHSNTPFSVGTGMRRPGRRLLTVGTDCALGKKYTALALAKAMTARGLKADFRATGQTGILISGSGVAVDAVVADFIAGAAESLSPANAPDHWDVIEGQGSLLHPAYAGVSLGLLHGSQPDALVLCHDPTRTSLNGFPHVPVRSLEEAMPPYLSAARLTNPNVRFVGISLNTSALNDSEARDILRRTSQSLGLPCVDPIRTSVDPIVDALETLHAG